MTLLRTQLGNTLRGHRLRQRRTLRDVSGRARVSLGYLSEVERGQKESLLRTAGLDLRRPRSGARRPARRGQPRTPWRRFRGCRRPRRCAASAGSRRCGLGRRPARCAGRTCCSRARPGARRRRAGPLRPPSGRGGLARGLIPAWWWSPVCTCARERDGPHSSRSAERCGAGRRRPRGARHEHAVGRGCCRCRQGHALQPLPHEGRRPACAAAVGAGPPRRPDDAATSGAAPGRARRHFGRATGPEPAGTSEPGVLARMAAAGLEEWTALTGRLAGRLRIDPDAGELAARWLLGLLFQPTSTGTARPSAWLWRWARRPSRAQHRQRPGEHQAIGARSRHGPPTGATGVPNRARADGQARLVGGQHHCLQHARAQVAVSELGESLDQRGRPHPAGGGGDARRAPARTASRSALTTPSR